MLALHPFQPEPFSTHGVGFEQKLLACFEVAAAGLAKYSATASRPAGVSSEPWAFILPVSSARRMLSRVICRRTAGDGARVPLSGWWQTAQELLKIAAPSGPWAERTNEEMKSVTRTNHVRISGDSFSGAKAEAS